jgi:hypothetical protein
MCSSSSVRARSLSAHAIHWQRDWSSSVRAHCHSGRASGSPSSFPVRSRSDRGFQFDRASLQRLWREPPEADPTQRAGGVAGASQAREGLAMAAGRARRESLRPASNQARPIQRPAASRETAGTRNDRPTAATGHAFPSDPREPRTQRHSRRPSRQCSPRVLRHQRSDVSADPFVAAAVEPKVEVHPIRWSGLRLTAAEPE